MPAMCRDNDYGRQFRVFRFLIVMLWWEYIGRQYGSGDASRTICQTRFPLAATFCSGDYAILHHKLSALQHQFTIEWVFGSNWHQLEWETKRVNKENRVNCLQRENYY